MKKLLFLFALVLGLTSMFSQKITTQAIDKPSEGKSLVYIVRSGPGFLLNFRFYDNETFLGAVSGTNYLVYECEPGYHLFWATSENRDYIEAQLEPNGVYVLNGEGQSGAFIAGVNFKPLNPNEFKDKKLFYQVIKNDTKISYTKKNDDKVDNVRSGLEKYKDLKDKNSKKIRVLDPSWKFENADKPEKNK